MTFEIPSKTAIREENLGRMLAFCIVLAVTVLLVVNGVTGSWVTNNVFFAALWVGAGFYLSRQKPKTYSFKIDGLKLRHGERFSYPINMIHTIEFKPSHRLLGPHVVVSANEMNKLR